VDKIGPAFVNLSETMGICPDHSDWTCDTQKMSDLRSHYFHLAFSEPPAREGLSESDPGAEEDVRLFRYELRQEVDEFLQRAEALLVAEAQGPKFYFNYIRANSFNGTSKLHNNYYFIGIHDGALRRMLPLARALAEKPELYKALGYQFTSDPSDELVSETADAIAKKMAYYTIGHELGHHVHGHTATEISARSKLERQAMEIEADCYSACLSVRAALQNSSDPNFKVISVRLFFLAAALFLECDERTIDWRNFQAEDYPPYSIRIEYLQGAIQETLQRLQPQNAGGLDNNSAGKLLKVLAGVWNPNNAFMKILHETDNLDLSTYTEYNKDLKEARLRLREELKPLHLKRTDDGGSPREAETGNTSDSCSP
jgi:hypothetical protein